MSKHDENTDKATPFHVQPARGIAPIWYSITDAGRAALAKAAEDDAKTEPSTRKRDETGRYVGKNTAPKAR